ncbi:hypothetical protein GCM10023156_46020 [Novipirellula rosea]|uniref:Outer membrane efflux protein n=2 Tax=Novipirellula rosea TaxID=1031540 RepID=A0ABP8N9R0_9BACT
MNQRLSLIFMSISRSIRRLKWIGSVVVAVSCLSALAEEPETEPNAVYVAKMQAVVDFLETELKTATDLLERQSSSKAEVDLARVDLAKARHNLAFAENNQAEVVRQCLLLVEIRSRQLQRHEKMAALGFGSKLKQIKAMRQLAGSRYLLGRVQGNPADVLDQLERVVQLHNEELSYLTRQQKEGAVSTMELNRARHRTTVAEHHLAHSKEDSPSVLPQLRQSAVLCQQEFDQIKRLRHLGYADVLDEYNAHRHLLHAKLLVADIENEPTAMQQQFDELIRLHEQTLPKLGSYRKGKLARLFIEQELARDHARKAQFLQDGYLADELCIAAMDF